MNSLKKLYRDFFGLREAEMPMKTPVPGVNPKDAKNLADYNKELEKTQKLMKSMSESEHTELDEAELLNHMEDYRGGVEYVIADPAQAQITANDIRQWAEKKGFKVIKQSVSASGKVGYFYFRLGENPYKESKKIQGYISQLPVVKHFRFNVRNQAPKQSM